MVVETLEERWTPTTIETAFVFHSPSPGKTTSRDISIDLPLLNLGWTFTLSLTPQAAPEQRRAAKTRVKGKPVKQYSWTPAAFSFRQHDSATPWGNTSIHAQLSLAVDPAEGCTPFNNTDRNFTPLGTIKVVLAHTSSSEVLLETSCILSSLRPNKVLLNVTISDCPLASGLFQVRSGHVNEAEVQTQLVRKSGNRLLSQSLTTGKLFVLDVEFLTPSTRFSSGDTGKPLPTYASPFVLEGHVNLSSCQ